MLNKGTLFLLSMSGLLSMNLVLRGAELAPASSDFKPVQSIGDVSSLISEDALGELKQQVDAGLNVRDYTFKGTPLHASWAAQRGISPLIHVRSPEMVDFLVSQGLDVNTLSQGFNPLKEVLQFQQFQEEEFEEDIDQKAWKSVFDYLKIIATIDRLRELGARWPKDEDIDEYESDREGAFDKTIDAIPVGLEKDLGVLEYEKLLDLIDNTSTVGQVRIAVKEAQSNIPQEIADLIAQFTTLKHNTTSTVGEVRRAIRAAQSNIPAGIADLIAQFTTSKRDTVQALLSDFIRTKEFDIAEAQGLMKKLKRTKVLREDEDSSIVIFKELLLPFMIATSLDDNAKQALTSWQTTVEVNDTLLEKVRESIRSAMSKVTDDAAKQGLLADTEQYVNHVLRPSIPRM